MELIQLVGGVDNDHQKGTVVMITSEKRCKAIDKNRLLKRSTWKDTFSDWAPGVDVSECFSFLFFFQTRQQL